MVTPGFHRPEIETLPRDRLEALQLDRLRSTVRRLRERVPVMAERLDGLPDPGSLDDLTSLPFLRKVDLRDNYPFGLFAEPRSSLARVHASSGTTRKPTVDGYTADDIADWAECVARSLPGAGVEPGQLLHKAYCYGLFTGGLGLHMGAEAAGIAPSARGAGRKRIIATARH